MNFTLRVWRQDGPTTSGRFEEYPAKNIPDEASFLEMLDIVNEELEKAGKESVQFDHDCREGICGMCSLTINGVPTAPAAARPASSTCASSRMATSSRSSRSGSGLSRSSATSP